jgi:hypothetical protein
MSRGHVVGDGPIDSRLFHTVYMNGVIHSLLALTQKAKYVYIGILYYVYLFALCIVNMVINLDAPVSMDTFVSSSCAQVSGLAAQLWTPLCDVRFCLSCYVLLADS